MQGRVILRAMATVTAGLMAGAALAAGQAALNGLQPGLWTLNEIGVDDAGRKMCVTAPAQFIQLYHPGMNCTRYVIDDTPEKVTVHYTCQGKGYGRTTVSVEDAQLIKLDTQGIGPDGQPFDKSYEGRRAGTCAR
jgi:hypothetical protein